MLSLHGTCMMLWISLTSMDWSVGVCRLYLVSRNLTDDASQNLCIPVHFSNRWKRFCTTLESAMPRQERLRKKAQSANANHNLRAACDLLLHRCAGTRHLHSTKPLNLDRLWIQSRHGPHAAGRRNIKAGS